MSFGRRTGGLAPNGRERDLGTPSRKRRGGYWLGLLTQLVVATGTMALLPFISQFRLNGATLATLAAPAAIALANVTVVAAVLMLLVDLVLRALRWRNPWIYAAICAVLGLIFYGAMALATGLINPIFALYVAVWPLAVGGWVLGWRRRRDALGR
jgi:hypothetical protein